VYRVHAPATAWLRRHGYVDEGPLEARSNEALEQSAIDGRRRKSSSGRPITHRLSYSQRDPKQSISTSDRSTSASGMCELVTRVRT
jgi:hypothetical protein